MEHATALPSFSAIVVAAGKGVRAEQALPKQFTLWRGKPVLRHSVEAMLDAGAHSVVIVISDGSDELAANCLKGLDRWHVVTGGETRQQSVANGLEALDGAGHVLIHDAARPDLPYPIIEKLLSALETYPGAIPVLPIVDSIIAEQSGLMAGPADRESLRRVQTPQAFHYEAIVEAHRAWTEAPTAT